MKILFLFLLYSKDENNTDLYKELAIEFKDRGEKVFVATINEKRNNHNTYLSNENGINVLRVKVGNYFNVGFLEKGITVLNLGRLFKNSISKFFDGIKFDMVIHSTPPITFTPVIRFLKHKYNTKSYLILRDIFPQNAKDLGLIKNQLLFKYFRMKEKSLYSNSDYIGCMSEGNIQYIRQHNPEVAVNKLHILRNWGKIKQIQTIDKTKTRQKYGCQSNDIIAIFGGNMGKPQNLDNLLNLAKLYTNSEGIKFIIVGGGTEANHLQKRIAEEKISNLNFIRQIPRNEYENVLASCDIGLISLSDKFTIPNIPSKTIDYFKLGLPVLACTDTATDYKSILEDEAEAGLHCNMGNLQEYKEKLDILIADKELRLKLGANGRKYYETYLGVEKAYETIIERIKNDKL